MSYGIVYLVTNKVNGKCYVGQTTKALKERWRGHLNCRHGALWDAIQEFGSGAFILNVLCEAVNEDHLDVLERKWIAALHAALPKYGYNKSPWKGGNYWTKDRVKEMRARFTGRGNPFFGKQHSAEQRARISAGSKGKPRPRAFPFPLYTGPRTLCECGCGRVAPLAKRTIGLIGVLKGYPRRFIHGHNGRS